MHKSDLNFNHVSVSSRLTEEDETFLDVTIRIKLTKGSHSSRRPSLRTILNTVLSELLTNAQLQFQSPKHTMDSSVLSLEETKKNMPQFLKGILKSRSTSEA